jgi:glycosyltransferase involved in cell wall biosynthesis
MNQSSGDAVILLDGDMQDPPELIPRLVSKWLEGYDVVYGQRVSRDAPAIMNFPYKSFYRIFNKISSINIPLDAGDFSFMDKKVVHSINSLKETLNTGISTKGSTNTPRLNIRPQSLAAPSNAVHFFSCFDIIWFSFLF